MRNILKGFAMALALGSAMAASVPAEARRDGWHSRGDHRGWDRGGRWDGDRHWRGDRGWRGDHYYGYRDYYGPRYRGYYAPRYGYGYGYPRYRHYRYYDNSDALIAGIAGIAIGAAIASSHDY